MDFDFTDAQQAFRRDVRSWLAEHVPADLRGRGFAASRGEREHVTRLRAWQRQLHGAGYVGMDWPIEYGGRGASIVEQIIFYEEMSRAEAPQPLNRSGLSMLGPTIMRHGTPAQQRAAPAPRCSPPRRSGARASPSPTRARPRQSPDPRRDGRRPLRHQRPEGVDEHRPHRGLGLLPAHGSERAKHKGITYFLVDMKTPGITMRPLKPDHGRGGVQRGLLRNVRVPAANVVGKVNEGWGVALTTLAYERDVLTMIRHISLRTALERLIARAKQTKRNGHTAAQDPVLRQKLASLTIAERCLQLNGYRSLTRILQGRPPGPEGSTSKLFWSQVDQELAEVATEVIGPYSQIAAGSEWAPDEGQWQFYALLARGSGIRAGTSEILRNILGERVLGLPKD